MPWADAQTVAKFFHHYIQTQVMNFSLHCKVRRNKGFGIQVT